ncbi:hypothetical protein KBP30_40010 [Streptomyces sp. Go40/10]|uniref:hypothetical protein n=1 Tax=Streptomyces sp. Go40/10 TaxID=2825844 RepID=UPI001E5B4AED|nr:hypothetical protein [Streptomyces sp. Go40/10]UFR06969.1 hypothetical protein KBP30_40010 [Streptomyces sp. Go40/10]
MRGRPEPPADSHTSGAGRRAETHHHSAQNATVRHPARAHRSEVEREDGATEAVESTSALS